MGKERNGTWKWLARILALCLVSFVTWWATQVWSEQKETQGHNISQDIDIKTLQDNIIATEKAVTSLERAFHDFREERRQKDSILQDVSFKINLMFEYR